MPGRASACEHPATVDTSVPGRVEVRTGGKLVPILDARMPGENALALAKAEARGGAVHAALRSQAEEIGGPLRAELNALAGGQAPPSVMALANLAIDALIDHRSTSLVGRGAFGRWSEATLDEEIAKLEGMVTTAARTTAGLAVIARDLLQAARAAAVEAGKSSKGSATEQLFGRIGLGQGRPGVDVGHAPAAGPTSVPVSTGGVVAVGAPLPLNPTSPTPSEDSE